jgi:hypothetical protein
VKGEFHFVELRAHHAVKFVRHPAGEHPDDRRFGHRNLSEDNTDCRVFLVPPFDVRRSGDTGQAALDLFHGRSLTPFQKAFAVEKQQHETPAGTFYSVPFQAEHFGEKLPRKHFSRNLGIYTEKGSACRGELLSWTQKTRHLAALSTFSDWGLRQKKRPNPLCKRYSLRPSMFG